MKAVNIEWDVDCQEDRELLPTEIKIPEGMQDEEDISDYISDITGFCHKGYNLVEDEVNKTRRLNVTIACQAVYNSSIEVPVHLSFEDALEYAKEHICDIPLGVLEYIPDSDELDVENCDFDEQDLEQDFENTLGHMKKTSLDQQIQSATTRVAESRLTTDTEVKEPEPEL